MLEWTESEKDGITIHAGTMRDDLYALIVARKNGPAYTQFKGLEGADLYSQYARVSPNVETAKKICTVMMSAWRHKAN